MKNQANKMGLELLINNVRIPKGYPYLVINHEDKKILVGADYHLGYEVVLAEEEGYYVPQSQFELIMEELDTIVKTVKPDIFIVNGDLKHKFSKRTRQETKEITEFLNYLSESIEKTYIIRGNHDNFVRGLFNNYNNIEFIEYHLVIGDYLFTHGHYIDGEIEDLMSNKVVVIGHEHPAILLYDDVGGKAKIPSFLYGKTKSGGYIIVLPAVSPLMSGIEVNITPQNEFLSPYIRYHTVIENLTPIGLLRGKENLRFPNIGVLKEVYTE